MHQAIKDNEKCGKPLDLLGNYAVICSTGGHIFARDSALNSVIGEAGKLAGYSVLYEQVIPELHQFSKDALGNSVCNEARLDLKLFGHYIAPDCIIDGTIRHPAARSIVMQSAVQAGFAAHEGIKDKARRCPPCGGCEVFSMCCRNMGLCACRF